MDDSFELPQESLSKESSLEDIDDYQDRVEQLKRITQRDQEYEQIEQQIPEDLKVLQEKIDKKMMKKPDQLKPKKQSYVPINQIRTALIIHLFKLYNNHKLAEDNIILGLTLSNFSPSTIEQMEMKFEQANNLQEKIYSLFFGFSLTYSIKNQLTQIKKETFLSPSDYIIRFAQICKYYGLIVRVVRAFDVGFLGLEQKFRIKTLKQDDQEVEENMYSNSNTILEKNQIFMEQSDTIESLDDYIFKMPNKKEVSKDKRQIQDLPIPTQKNNKKQQTKKQLSSKQINDEIDKLNECLWLEFYSEQGDDWIPFDPISDRQVTLNIASLKQKLQNSFSHFIIAAQTLNFIDNEIKQQRIFGQTYFVDVTPKYATSYNIQRLQLSLQKWFNFLCYSARLIYKGLPKLVKEPVIADQKIPPPSTLKQDKDFKYSPFYAITSQLSQYQMIHPDAQALEDKFKEENIYRQSDVVTLHSKDKWREYLREVQRDVLPIKEVSQRFDKTKTTALFAPWQTEDIKVSLDQNNGEFPVNQYGNYETFAFPPPKGTKLVLVTGIKNLLQKNGFKFVEAVDGFDAQGGKMFAQKCGYLVYDQDYEKILQLYEEHKVELAEKNKINKRKELMKQWSDLFKSILLKRDLQNKYQI